MAYAHTGSRLQLKGLTPALPDGMILFPLAGTTHNTTADIPILEQVITYRDDVKRFNGSVAVESETTNFWEPHTTDPVGCEIEEIDTSNNYVRVKITGTSGAAHERNRDVPFDSSIGTLTFKCRVLNMDSVELSPYLSGRNNSADRGPVYTITKDWQTVSYTQRNYLTGSWNRATFYIANAARHNGAIIEFKEIQVEPLDHATSFTPTSRPNGTLAYDISHLGMRDAGCISCWVYHSDSLVNNKATNGQIGNQYLLTVRHESASQQSDLITLSARNATPRNFTFWSGNENSQSHHIYSIFPVDQYGEIGSWNHYILQWDKEGLPSGNRKEFYINGELQGRNNTTILPENLLRYLYVGTWSSGSKLIPSTLFEQLAIHPTQGFSAEQIRNWYNANAPFYDFRDTHLYW